MTVLRCFWWLLTMACVVWYATITVFVAIRGAFDIRQMLSRLSDRADKDRHDSPPEGGRSAGNGNGPATPSGGASGGIE